MDKTRVALALRVRQERREVRLLRGRRVGADSSSVHAFAGSSDAAKRRPNQSSISGSRPPSVVATSVCSSGSTSKPAASDAVATEVGGGVAARARPSLVLEPHHVVHALLAVRAVTDVRVEHETDDRALDVVVHLLVRGEPLEHLRRRLLQRLHEASRLLRLQIGDVPRLQSPGSPACEPTPERAARRSPKYDVSPSATHSPVVTGACS